MGDLFASGRDCEEAAGDAARIVREAVSASSCAILSVDAGTGELASFAVVGARRGMAPLHVDDALRSLLLGWRDRPLLLAGNAERSGPLRQCEGAIRQLGAAIWLPLVIGNELLGVLSVGDRRSGKGYGEQDLRFLWASARQLSICLYAHRLAEGIRKAEFQLNLKAVEFETLYDAGLTLSSSLQVEEVIEDVLLLAVGVVDARAGFLFLRDERSKRLGLAHHIGLTAEQVTGLQTPALRRRMGRAAREQRVLHLGPKTIPKEVGAAYMAVAPVGEVGFVGVVDKEHRRGIQDFSEADVQLLELMGQQSGAAISNARLYKSILEMQTYSENVLSSIGNGVISTDLKGRIERVNPSVSRIFGEEPSPVGRSCAGFFRTCGCHAIAEAVRDSLSDGAERDVDGEQVSGRDISLNARVSALRDEHNEVQGVVVTLEDLTETTRIRQMFSQYASDQVVDTLLAGKSAPTLGGEVRDVTILFVDTRGSTALLDRIGAEDMVNLLNDCFSRLNEIVFRHSGTHDKYTGDGFMVIYGAPVSFPDNSERALLSALAMREEMTRFNRGKPEPLHLAYGLARGQVVAGNIGSHRRMEYTVIGPAVVVASRFCDYAEAGQIWVDANVYEELKDRFQFEYLGPHRFKGVDPVDVYEASGPKGKGSGRRDAKERVKTGDQGEQKVDLSIPMVSEMELAASRTAEAVAEFMRMDQDKVEEIKLALIEACINAFEHSQSKDQRVYINFEVNGEELTVRITDKGQGFDPGQAREAVLRRRERGETRRGWGLKIMEGLMDTVAIRSDADGTVVTMTKRR